MLACFKPIFFFNLFFESLIACTGKNIDKFTQILFHPTARDLLVGVTNDYGQAHIRFWDLSKGEEVKVIDLPAPSVCLFLDTLFL